VGKGDDDDDDILSKKEEEEPSCNTTVIYERTHKIDIIKSETEERAGGIHKALVTHSIVR